MVADLIRGSRSPPSIYSGSTTRVCGVRKRYRLLAYLEGALLGRSGRDQFELSLERGVVTLKEFGIGASEAFGRPLDTHFFPPPILNKTKLSKNVRMAVFDLGRNAPELTFEGTARAASEILRELWRWTADSEGVECSRSIAVWGTVPICLWWE